MSLTDAIKEAYAANPTGESIIETIEMDHPTFDEPVRIATGVEEDVLLPLVDGGTPVTFRALQVSVVLPGVTEDGPTPARIRIDNVSGLLLPYLQDAIQSTEPLELTYRAYTTTDLSEPGEIISDLQLREVALSALAAEGSVGFKEVELQAFPLPTYDEEYYPALQNN